MTSWIDWRAHRAWRGATVLALVPALALLPSSRAAHAQVRDTTRAAPRDTTGRDTTGRDTTVVEPAADSLPDLMQRFGIDRLRLSSVGVAYGQVKPARVEAADIFAVYADYGEVAPRWRVVVGAAYWRSRYEDGVVQRFADSLATVITDPPEGGAVTVGTIRATMLALTLDMRYHPRRASRVRPYVGGGIGAYAGNVEGAPISGTFVENSMDNIAAGFAAVAGLDLRILPNVSFDMQARYDLLSGTRYGSLRAGGSYIFNTRGRQ